MVSPELLLTQILNGLSYGFSIALVAIGLTLIFGLMDIVNFAHGEFYMLGGFGLLVLLPILPNFWLAVIVAMIAVGVIALVLERLTITPIHDRDPLHSLIITFGLLLILQQVAFEIWGGGSHTVSAPISGSISIFGVSYPTMRLFTIVACIGLLIAVWLALERTRIGIMVRASAQDLETARTLGVPANRIFTLVFAASAMLAVLAAAFLIPVRSVYPTVGTSVILDAFIVVIIGGLGSIPGAVIAALLIGLVQSLSVIWVASYLAEVISFAILIAVMIFRPQGIFAREE